MATSTLINKLSIATAAFMAVGCIMPGGAFAVSITSTVVGSPNPTPINGQSLQNGGFRITPNQDTFLGDGDNEFTKWEFDFNNDPNLALFAKSGPLTSALLTLTLSPKSLFDTDTTGMETDPTGMEEATTVRGIANLFTIPGIPSEGQTGTVTLNLFDYGFTSAEILGAFNSGKPNAIRWGYQDDAIISFAQLELQTRDVASVPEPASVLGILAFGAFGAASQLKRKKQQKA